MVLVDKILITNVLNEIVLMNSDITGMFNPKTEKMEKVDKKKFHPCFSIQNQIDKEMTCLEIWDHLFGIIEANVPKTIKSKVMIITHGHKLGKLMPLPKYEGNRIGFGNLFTFKINIENGALGDISVIHNPIEQETIYNHEKIYLTSDNNFYIKNIDTTAISKALRDYKNLNTTIILIRHSKALHNGTELLYENIYDPPLVNDGIESAHSLGRKLKENKEIHQNIHILPICSELNRTVMTLHHICRGADISFSDNLSKEFKKIDEIGKIIQENLK